GDVTLLVRIELDRSDFALLNLECFVELSLPATQAIDLFVRHHECLDHDLFRYFDCTGFNHDDRFFSSSDNQVQARLTHFVVSWINDVTSFDQADTHACDGVQER